MSGYVVAQYEGWCSVCRSPVHIGEKVARARSGTHPGGASGWVHARCEIDEPTDFDAAQQMTPCPTCFMVGPCDCDGPTTS